MGLILLLYIILAFFNYFPSPTSPFNEHWPTWLPYVLVYLVPLGGAIIFSQIYRYRRLSNPVQRQQTKWIVLGVTVAVGLIIGFLAINFLFPNNVNSNTLGGQIVSYIIWPIVLLLMPLSIGFSILRYRLYDIDVLINRTLVSTLAIAALVQPLRHRIQAIIDQRFYRRKYDTAKTLEAFSATLRNEVDLSQLSEQLLNVVQESMQPAHVSLWLRKPDHDSKQHSNLNEEKGL